MTGVGGASAPEKVPITSWEPHANRSIFTGPRLQLDLEVRRANRQLVGNARDKTRDIT